MNFKNVFTGTLFLLFSHVLTAQTDFIGDPSRLPGHPRILLLKGEEEVVKKTIGGDKIWGKMQQAILDESDRIVSLAPIERIKIGRRLLDKSREALRRLFFLSYACRTTRDQKYLRRA